MGAPIHNHGVSLRRIGRLTALSASGLVAEATRSDLAPYHASRPETATWRVYYWRALNPRLLPIARDRWAKVGGDAIWPDTRWTSTLGSAH